MLSFLYTFFISLHYNGHEDVLNSSIEENQKDNEVDLARKPFSPGLKESIVDNITVEKREESDNRRTGVFEFIVLPEDSLSEEDETEEERHDSEQEHEQVVPGLRKCRSHEIKVVGVFQVLENSDPGEHDTESDKDFLVPKDDQLGDDEVVEDGDQGSKELEKVASDDDDEPEIKELHFIEKPEFFPVFVPVQVRLYSRVLDF